MTFGLEVRTEDWPHGLRCADCNRLLVEDDRYSKRLESMLGDTPLSLIVCAGCALGPPTEQG